MDQNNNPTEMVDGVTPETAAKSEPTQKQPQSGGNQVLTMKEKYFQIEPEGRIRRYQYFVRSIIPAILLFFIVLGGTILMLPLMMILGKFSALISLVISGGVYWVIFNLAKVNTIKRSHDFGSDGKLAVYVVTASFVMSIIWLVVGALQGLGILPTVDINSALSGLNQNGSSDDPMMAIKQVSDAMKNATPLYQRLLGYIGNVVNIASFVTWIVLLFRPGVSGDNQYGKDSANNKVSFLG